MKLITASISKQLAPIGATSEKPASEVLVPLKLFDPCGSGTWFITEFDGEDLMFGLCYIFEPELGYVSFKELQSVRNPFGLGIERDKFWNGKTTLQEVQNAFSKGRCP